MLYLNSIPKMFLRRSLFSTFALVTVIFILLPSPILTAFTTPNGFTFEAIPSPSSATTLIVTIRGALAADSWVGLGIPDPSTTPGMRNADLFIATYDNNNVIVTPGLAPGAKNFTALTGSAVQVLSVVTASSSYTNGIINAVFTLPSVLPNGRNIANMTTFLWALGPRTNATSYRRHTERDVINGTLLNAAATITSSIGTSTSTNTSTTSTRTSSAASVPVSMVSVVMVALIAVFAY
ncbi:hypothetical protein BC829DRAFT_436227 [Chytridium lagenaria]|nr:hypothetical protein BC829DRAFT_436227 [Chytridium lagenaria]